jgi:hypothetical protein
MTGSFFTDLINALLSALLPILVEVILSILGLGATP